MDLDRFARRLATYARPAPEAAPRPQDADPDPTDQAGDLPPPWLEARLERAAIMEFDGGLSRAEAEAEAARLHPDPAALAGPWPGGITRDDLRAAAAEDWPAIRHRPEVLQALAFALASAKTPATHDPASP